MDLKKYVRWNWFNKEEEDAGKTAPVQRGTDDLFRFPASLDQFHKEFDKMFEQAFRGFGHPMFRDKKGLLSDSVLRPTLDLSASDKEYTVSVEIPGVDEKDIKLEIANDTLVIRGEKKQEKESKEDDFYRMERSYGSFERVLSLPDDADQEKVSAEFRNGVLKVTMQRKALPKHESKPIEIKKS